MNQILFKEQPTCRLHVGAIFRDVLVLLGITSLAVSVAHFGFRAPSAEAQELGEIELVFVLTGCIVGFAIVGAFASSGRWQHLIYVWLGTWAVGLLNIPLLHFTFLQWLGSGLLLVVTMAVGGALSYVFRRKSKSEDGPVKVLV